MESFDCANDYLFGKPVQQVVGDELSERGREPKSGFKQAGQFFELQS
jgi:hypothetical protein